MEIVKGILEVFSSETKPSTFDATEDACSELARRDPHPKDEDILFADKGHVYHVRIDGRWLSSSVGEKQIVHSVSSLVDMIAPIFARNHIANAIAKSQRKKLLEYGLLLKGEATPDFLTEHEMFDVLVSRIPENDPRAKAFFGEYMGHVTSRSAIAEWGCRAELGKALHASIERYLNAVPTLNAYWEKYVLPNMDEEVSRRFKATPPNDLPLREQLLRSASDGGPERFPIFGVHELLDELEPWRSRDMMQSVEFGMFMDFLRNEPNQEFCRTEWRIFDRVHLITGTIDAVSVAKRDENGKIMAVHLYDWKRVKDIDGKKDRYRGPFSSICGTKVVKYSVQLHLYKHILETQYGVQVMSMHLIVLNPSVDSYKKITVWPRPHGAHDVQSLIPKLLQHHVETNLRQL